MNEKPRHPEGRRDAGLDGVRGLAALLVAFGHVSLISSGGDVGMPLFFALSGYLITGILLRERARTGTVDRRAFYVRRIARLAPAMLLLLVVVGATGTASPVSWLTSIAYVKNWQMAGSLTVDPLAHVWSLAIEEQYYLLAPLVILGLTRLRLGLVLTVGLAIASALLRAEVAGFSVGHAYYGTDTRADALLLGSALAIAVQLGWHAPRWLGWAGLAAVIGAAFLPLAFPWLTVGLALGAVAAVALIAGGAPGLAWLAPVGRISYGFYLAHWPIVLWLGGQSPSLPVALAGIALALAIATVSYFVLEQRVIRWARLADKSIREKAAGVDDPGRAGLDDRELELGLARP